MISDKFLKPYQPAKTEPRIYALWEESGFFNPDNLPPINADKKTRINADRNISENQRVHPGSSAFCMVMPPTNANGSLHAGHALVMTIEDIMTRYKRMRGFKTLWLPGLDHAGFETQVVYEKELEKQNRSRFNTEPKKLYDEILAFTLQNSKNIKAQVRSMGASCDWSREKFTLDPDIIKTVYDTFKRLADDGLLYRGKRIVSWCPRHKTSFSDLEIENVERTDPFYYLRYGPFVIGTARPETKFGDKYVVMHPDDSRYARYAHGEKIKLEWINGEITATVIKDEAVDMEFGTGVMTITPWHDTADFEIAERHNLDKEQIIDEDGKLLPIAGEFSGMQIKKARPLIVEKLKAKGLLEKTDEKYAHTVRTCYKCGSTIEPQIQNQWFVRMKPLAEKALEKIQAGEIVFIPDHYQKIITHWLKNIIDWNISRQIVWGIPIPAKVCNACEHGMVDLQNAISRCEKCGGAVRADADTFDTWFSSAQWPFATLGYPDGNDFRTFYPTDVMETAGEIIFFWVARMIMMGLYVTGKIPFKTVYLHGLVLDAKGQKMSKSKGNVINPLTLTSKFGTDALRMGLIAGNTPGTSLALSEDKIRGYKHFANKLWNIARFILENTNGIPCDKNFSAFEKQDSILRKELGDLLSDITKDMEAYRFYLAAEKLYHYVWHTLADNILEESKTILKNGTPEEKKSRQQFLLHTLDSVLRALHPFMPFITEEIWGVWRETRGEKREPRNNLLMVQEWPTAGGDKG